MFLFLYLAIIIGVYVITFKNDFKTEQLEKVTPFLIIMCVILTLLGLIGGVGR